MSRSRPTWVTLDCPHGHVGEYLVGEGKGTHCKTCRKPGACDQCPPEGREVSIYNSAANRARNLQPAAAATSPSARQLGRLGAWWDAIAAQLAEAERAELLGVAEVADTGDGGRPCPRCGEPMRWAGGYTALICCSSEHPRPVWVRDAGALERGRAHAASKAPAARTGPAPAEAAEVDAERAVILDTLEGWRELLGKIPRGDYWRADAVRGLQRLEQLAQRCRDATTPEALEGARRAGARLLGDGQGEPGELGELLKYARHLADQQARPSGAGRRGLLRLGRGRGGTWEYDDNDQADDDQADDDQGEALVPARPAASSVLCGLCFSSSRQQLAVARISSNVPAMIPNGDVCAEHFRHYADVTWGMPNAELIILVQYGIAPGVHSITRGVRQQALEASAQSEGRRMLARLAARNGDGT